MILLPLLGARPKWQILCHLPVRILCGVPQETFSVQGWLVYLRAGPPLSVPYHGIRLLILPDDAEPVARMKPGRMKPAGCGTRAVTRW